MPNDPSPETPSETEALQQAIAALLAPVARLAVGRGLPIAAVEASLRAAFVQAAREAHPQLAPNRAVSRISAVTGLHRREVARLLLADAKPAPPRRSLASEVFARWTTDPAYARRRSGPRTLPRQGPSPSFETLAQSVTRDIHPRSLLDELLRLGLATLDAEADTVQLVRDAFVPRGDALRMLGFLGDNVGDHLGAAVANVLGDGRRHFEQAVFAGGLSDASLAQVRAQIGAQWQSLVEALVPALQALVDRDAGLPEGERRRLRIGLYSYDDAPSPPAADAGTPTSEDTP